MNAKVFGILTLLGALCVFMAVMTAEPWYDVTDSTFLKPNNIENLLRRTSMYGILGIGVAFVIITGGIDLSVGSVVCLSGCLLAIFLEVDYRGVNEEPIYRVRGGQQTIVLPGAIDTFAAGDRIRYSGGRRASSALLTVEKVELRQVPLVDGEPAWEAAVAGAASLEVTQLSVNQPLSADDRYGQVAKAFDVLEIVRGRSRQGPTTITLAGDHSYLAPRDQLVLVHPQSGLKQVPIEAVTTRDRETVVTLADDPGDNFSNEWFATPLKRRQRMPIPAAVLAVLATALALGLLHGLLVTRMKLQPFVVTLCGLLIYRGISRWLVGDQPVGFGTEYEHTLSPLGAGKWELWRWETANGFSSFGIPYPFFILAGTALIAAIFLNRTIWGRYLLALGRNEEAARYSGINTRRITMVAFVISTVMAAIGGILFALDSNSISPSSFGNFFELYAIAAAVLGGCSLRGGEGSILGVIIGTAVMQVLYNLIVLMRISGTLEFAIIGIVILTGVVVDELVKRLAARRRALAQAKASA